MTEPAEAIDSGPARRGRARLCAVTREVLPEQELIRFVAAPDASVAADLKAKLPGRGIWVRAERSRVAEAVKRNVFARGLKQPLKPAPDLADEVARRMREAALGRLGLARKAGVVAAGFAKVEAALGASAPAALLIAADAAEDGRRKIEQALFRGPGGAGGVPVMRLFGSAELSLALGLPNVIHAAVLQGPAGKSFVEAAIRLQRYDGVGHGAVAGVADQPQDVTE